MLIQAGDQIAVNYIGSIDKHSATGRAGSVFDSSYSRGQPFSFQLGAGTAPPRQTEGAVQLCSAPRCYSNTHIVALAVHSSPHGPI